MLRLPIFITILVCILPISIASAQTPQQQATPVSPGHPPSPPEISTAHRGFLAKMTIGGGYLSLRTDVNGTDLNISGLAMPVGVVAGLAVIENLFIIFGVDGYVAFNPSASAGSVETEVDGTATAVTVGGGVLYYIMPYDIFVQGVVGAGFSRLILDGDPTPGETDWGPSFSLSAGKEWWFGGDVDNTRWGFGLGLNFVAGFYPDEDETVVATGLGVIATFGAEL